MYKIRAQRLPKGGEGGGGREGGEIHIMRILSLYMESCHSIITMYGENIKGVCLPST